jgi:hypothetical protein
MLEDPIKTVVLFPCPTITPVKKDVANRNLYKYFSIIKLSSQYQNQPRIPAVNFASA